MTEAAQLECACCIQERLAAEGKWDRFGTTEEQELKATCDRHLRERISLWSGHNVPEWDAVVDKCKIELSRRHPQSCA
jgi:hypothetical protein